MTATLTLSLRPRVPGGFRVEVTLHGMLVFGAPTVAELDALVGAWAGHSETKLVLCAGIASALGALTAIAHSREAAAAWRTEVRLGVESRYPDDPQRQWLHGLETGVSSLTMFSVLADSDQLQDRARPTVPAPPWDSEDWVRCRNMVDLCGFRDRLQEVVDRFPEFAPWVQRWDRLEDFATVGPRSALDALAAEAAGESAHLHQDKRETP